MDQKKNGFIKFSQTSKLMPQEEMLEVATRKSELTIGVPKEISFQENRVPICPAMVELLVQNGHKVILETNAGKAAHFPDNEYIEAGGNIVSNAREVYKADLILKVAPLSISEIDMLENRQTVLSAINITGQNDKYFKKLIKKRAIAIAFEYIKDKTNTFPIIRSLSEIVGNTVILIAAEYLSNHENGKGRMVGGVSGIAPTEVVIIGAGTVGENAARAAMGLGAVVKVFDNSIYKLRRLQDNLKTKIYTSIIQPKILKIALQSADVAIGAVHSNEGRTSFIVSEDMVMDMKEGSVIVDVSIDQGGCFETSQVTNHLDPVFTKFGVTHYCVPNISSRVPNTASLALSNNFGPILLKMGEEGGVESLLKADYGICQGVYIYKGIITKKFISDYYGLPFQDIELLMAAFH